MPEHDNDRLEQFFRKATGKPEVTFNEDDWKKLEMRLDAEEAGLAKTRKAGSKIVSAVAIALILGFSGAVWVNAPSDKVAGAPVTSDEQMMPQENPSENEERSSSLLSNHASSDDNENIEPKTEGEKSAKLEEGSTRDNSEIPSVADKGALQEDKMAEAENPTTKTQALAGLSPNFIATKEQITSDNPAESLSDVSQHRSITSKVLSNQMAAVTKYDDEKIFNDLIRTSDISPAIAEKIKQKAFVELPGAEEETSGAEAVMREEHASENEHESLPRLSLLLSFAPDFSSTTYDQYTTPGRAFGAMVHYHVLNRWSLSAGVIKNNKKYTSAGEDYHPPKGYWKYYTNGVIPYSIDGSCSVLEFPVMIQYTIAQGGKSRWLAGAGVSSYLMLNESYRYTFEQPNPGAKGGWDSSDKSRFLFNMVNFSVGYERRVLPGLMMGIEPYVKVPLEEIGWSNLKLFSTGASISLRYTMVRRRTISTPTRSRGPD